MTSFIRRAMMVALLVSTASVAVVTALDPVDAAQRGAPQRQTGPVARSSIGTPINDSIKLIQSMDFDGALAKVEQADKIDKKTPYEEYLVAKFLGVIAVSKPTRDFPAATAAYNRMMDSGGAPDAEKESMYDLAMKLNYQAEDWAKVVEAADALKMIRPLDDTGYEVLAQTYYKTNDMPNTIATAKESVAAAQAAGGKPTASMLGLLLNAQAKQQDPGYRATLDQLGMVSSQAEVWGQIMDFALATKDITDHQLLNVFRLAIRVGTMRDTDYPAMATIDLSNGLSIEGKTILEKAIMSGVIMRTGAVASLITQANGLIDGEKKSLPEIAAEAGKQANGEIYVKLGESYWVNGQTDMAIDALQKGIEKGGLKDAADAQTTLGIVLMDAGRSAEAIEAFQKAEASGGTGAQIAHPWSLYSRRTV
jgi:tetratricopeptide (TPR) repeat protein